MINCSRQKKLTEAIIKVHKFEVKRKVFIYGFDYRIPLELLALNVNIEHHEVSMRSCELLTLIQQV